MNQISISLSEEAYKELKAEASRKRKSLSTVIKEKITPEKKRRKYSKAEVEEIMKETERVARENAKVLKGWNSLKALREIRDEN